MIYLDNAASSAPSELMLENQIDWLTRFYANPDATHEAGYQSMLAVQRAELLVNKLTGATGLAKIIWTGTATEAINIAITGYCSNFKDGEIVTTNIEHKAVLEPAHRSHLSTRSLPLTKEGIIDVEAAHTVLSKNTRMIAIHHINNETGVIQPIAELAKVRDQICPKAIIMLDAAQSFGKIPINWQTLGIDMLVATAHKIHGINGTAILQYNQDLKLTANTFGGGQQENLRSGTLNVAGIVAFSEAFKLTCEELKEVSERITSINQYTRRELTRTYGKRIHFHASEALSDPHILSFALEGYQGAILMRGLGAEGIIIGTGSACLAEVNSASHVMTELGVAKHLAFSTLRVSFGRQNKMSDAKLFLELLEKVVADY